MGEFSHFIFFLFEGFPKHKHSYQGGEVQYFSQLVAVMLKRENPNLKNPETVQAFQDAVANAFKATRK